ncbi:MAG: hypothetical protein EB084_20605, partial [Proteobacteria bacterium]|nr:hypothetical protein [Pseudomonadota bacterium]
MRIELLLKIIGSAIVRCALRTKRTARTPARTLTLALCGVALAAMAWLNASPADAQRGDRVAGFGIPSFGLPGPLNAVGDMAIRAALSEFGRSLRGQMPIDVSPDDAYPTCPLPGTTFSPGSTIPNLAGLLAASQDGTVRLAAGDYAFPVDVFCMKAHAGSPSGHRYLVAPLKGSAADIFCTLNARLPAFRLDHHAVQVLSWNIQAGLGYSDMQPPQRAIVDQVIPDLRPRLTGDTFEKMQRQFDQIASGVPGMPSFGSALGRCGAAGQAVLALQELRREMLSPPPTFEDLARALVPFMPPITPSSKGETPWSRYSPRVFVRFVTSG